MPALTLRNVKGTPLTNAELDDNFTYLDNATPVSVKNFGAVGDGVTDDTLAIRAAIAAAYALGKSGNSGIYGNGVYVGTAPTVQFPSGVYKITDYLTPDTGQSNNYVNFCGESAIIVASAGVVAFGGIAYNTSFKGLVFRGGASAISIKTNNVDTTHISIRLCEFHNQTHSCVRTDEGSNSTLLTIDDCKFTQYDSVVGSEAYIGYFPTGDKVIIQNSWVTAAGYCAFYNGGCWLHLEKVLGVPIGYLNLAGGRWIDNYATTSAHGTRFGGEGAGAAIIYNYANDLITDGSWPYLGSSIVLEDCQLLTGGADRADRGVIISKVGLPNNIRIVGCNAPVDSYYINDQQTSGTLLDKLSAFTSNYNTAPLFIQIENNGSHSWGLGNLANSTPLVNALKPFVMYSYNTDATTKRVGFQMPNINALKISSQIIDTTNYPQTSSTSGVSIVDTGIFQNTDVVGFGYMAVYDVYITGNSTPGGSGAYRLTQTGQLVIGTSFVTGKNVINEIFYVPIANPNYQDLPELTVAATFWDGSSESTQKSSGTNYQIRLKIGGYPAGQEGHSQRVQIIRRF